MYRYKEHMGINTPQYILVCPQSSENSHYDKIKSYLHWSNNVVLINISSLNFISS